MRARLLLVPVLLAGCGAPSEPAKQAEAVGSIAAEGELLAHDAAEGATTGAFTRVHAQALAKALDELRPKLGGELRRLADDVAAGLDRLARAPRDEAGARRVEQRLEDAAKRAEELAG